MSFQINFSIFVKILILERRHRTNSCIAYTRQKQDYHFPIIHINMNYNTSSESGSLLISVQNTLVSLCVRENNPSAFTAVLI